MRWTATERDDDKVKLRGALNYFYNKKSAYYGLFFSRINEVFYFVQRFIIKRFKFVVPRARPN